MSSEEFTTRNLRQYFAAVNGNTLPNGFRQNPAVEIPYRTLLANNLNALMRYRGVTPETIKATYLDGTKKGKLVAVRTISPIARGTSPSTGIDVLAALAAALDVRVYHLLVPELDPASQPPQQTENWIAAEVERRVVARLRNARKAKEGLRGEIDEENPGKPNSKSPFIDSAASIGSTPSGLAKAQAAATKAARGSAGKKVRHS